MAKKKIKFLTKQRGRPPGTDPYERVNISIGSSLHTFAKLYAVEHDMSFSALVSRALKTYFGEE